MFFQDPMLFVVDGVKLGKLTKIQQLSECSFEEFSPNCERNFEHQRNPQQRIKIENSIIPILRFDFTYFI